MLVMFVAMCILEEMKRQLATDQMKVLKGGAKHVEVARNTYDFDEVVSALSSVGYSRRNSNGVLLVREVLEKQEMMAVGCGCKDIFKDPYTY